jgi:hypothetical protein
MGNNVSSGNSSSINSSNSDELRNMALRLDLYAQRIILKEVKFNSTLGDSGKCEKLIIITSEVLNRLPFRLISYMDRRHKLFSERYEMINAMDRALLVNTNPEILKESKLDEQNVFRKKQMCVGIARFYVQIGNLFNAIMSTMRPYNYEYIQRNMPENFYDMLTFGLLDGADSRNKDKSKYETSSMAGFVRRQNDTKMKMERLLRMGDQTMKITPGSGICSIQKDMENIKITPMSTTTTASTATQNKIKPSIFAMLEELYFDIFHETSSVNPSSPQFIAMSERMKNKIYKRDVAEIFRIVTDGKEPGEDIRTFADVSKYINDNDKMKEWCNKNKGLELNVDNNMRSNPLFVKYIRHIQNMNYQISKQRKVIVRLLDRVFSVMKKNEDVLQEIEENFDKANFKRYVGFEQDDQYSRDFYRLNLKYDLFINPNLTDADLQVITNEARTRIVRLYADSYKFFMSGFEILQELQQTLSLETLVQARELAKQQTENPTKMNNIENKYKELAMNEPTLAGEKLRSEKIMSELAFKNGEISNVYREIVRTIIEKDETDPVVRANSQSSLARLNLYIVNNILKYSGQRDINEEYKYSILNELKKIKGKIDAESRQAVVVV